MPEETPQTDCPIACPNRKKEGIDRNRSKWGTYGFALLLCFFAVAFSFKRTDSGWEPKEEPPVTVWAILFPAIGLCLGVQIDAEAIGRMIGK